MSNQFTHKYKCRLLGKQDVQKALVNYLSNNLYIDNVELNGKTLIIEYDFRYMVFEQVLAMIKLKNCDYENGFVARIKYQLMTNADIKGRENLAIEPFCCDKVKIRKENI